MVEIVFLGKKNLKMILNDVKIILKTIVKVFKREGISQEGNATIEKFTGTNKE